MGTRQTVYLESSPSPVGDSKLMANEFEIIYQLATDKRTRVENLTLGNLHIKLSELTGKLAVIVWTFWTTKDLEYEVLRGLLREIMLYCLLAIEALDGQKDRGT
jgi:hypothetical protein